MHQSFWKLAPAFVILAGSSALGGCATRGYVDEQIAGVNQRIDSLDARVQSTESGVQAAQAAAQAASGQAQQVNQRVDQLNSRVDGIERVDPLVHPGDLFVNVPPCRTTTQCR